MGTCWIMRLLLYIVNLLLKSWKKELEDWTCWVRGPVMIMRWAFLKAVKRLVSLDG